MVNTTALLGSQLVDIFVKGLQIDTNCVKNEDGNMESSNENNDDLKDERGKDDTTEVTKKVEDRENKIRSSNRKQNQLLMELLETELNYVDDLEEVKMFCN